VADHEGGETLTINKHDLERVTLSEALSRLGEIRGGHKYALICFGCPETAAKCPDLGFANGVSYTIALSLNINPFES
jgi:hypothetical protein